MIQIKRFACLAATLLTSVMLVAQTNGSNSSYSRFGLGTSNNQSQGFNRAMGGVAQGMRDGGQVNFLNPASYAVIDSLTFLFDVGMGMQQGHMKSNGTSLNAFNASLEYVNAGFRMKKGLGMSIGFMPYTTIGYNFDTTKQVGSSYTSSKSISTETNYYGNGGLHEIYMGVGWNPIADLNIGANIGYLWGAYTHTLDQQFYEGGKTSSNYNTQNEVWDSDIKTYKIDFGVQYPIKLNKKNSLTLGASASIGHNIGSEVKMLRFTSKGDTLTSKATDAFELPYVFSGGASWRHGDKLTIAADYTQERWSGCKVPISYSTATSSSIQIVTNQYLNRHRFALGAEYIINPMGRKYGQLIRYRLGASYATPNIKVNGEDGPTEYGITAGVALPLTTRSKSLINVTAEWMRRSPSTKGQITENYLMLHLGITFNEAWFMKWKFQ
ncbi:MAG: hypothetical protein J5671_05895 [Bacteroidaceae bacterium]|nr:hypothetical protein [Bacteroidaceae bacterium]